jgi:hypothetical protein
LRKLFNHPSHRLLDSVLPRVHSLCDRQDQRGRLSRSQEKRIAAQSSINRTRHSDEMLLPMAGTKRLSQLDEQCRSPHLKSHKSDPTRHASTSRLKGPFRAVAAAPVETHSSLIERGLSRPGCLVLTVRDYTHNERDLHILAAAHCMQRAASLPLVSFMPRLALAGG